MVQFWQDDKLATKETTWSQVSATNNKKFVLVLLRLWQRGASVAWSSIPCEKFAMFCRVSAGLLSQCCWSLQSLQACYHATHSHHQQAERWGVRSVPCKLGSTSCEGQGPRSQATLSWYSYIMPGLYYKYHRPVTAWSRSLGNYIQSHPLTSCSGDISV